MSELKAITSVFNIEIEKIDPNPDQPRKYFSDESLRDLSESIRRYGVMQPITVFRRETETPDGGISTRYEIIAGERRWRASVMAGMNSIPAIIHEEEASEQERYELSILENLQREDLNPVDKARSFERLANDFGMKHAEIADKLGKSREYVTNAMRLLALPENILDALSNGYISEGHTRPLLSLKDKPEELQVLFSEITTKGLNVRETEKVGRELSSGSRTSRVEAKAQAQLDPEIQDLQKQLADTLGTAVSIDKREQGGKVTIDFFSRDDLKKLLAIVSQSDSLKVKGVEEGIEVNDTTTTPEGSTKVSNTTDQTPVTADDFVVNTATRPVTSHEHENQTPAQPSYAAPLQEEDDFFKANSLNVTDEVAVETMNETKAAQAYTQSLQTPKPASALQEEIDALAEQTKENEVTHAGNIPKKVELGDIAQSDSVYTHQASQPSGTTTFQGEVKPGVQFGQVPPYQKADASGQSLERGYPGTVSEPVFGNVESFVPQEAGLTQEADIAVAGSDFIPQVGGSGKLDQAMNSLNDPFSQQNQTAQGHEEGVMRAGQSEAQITMGGLHAGFSDKDDDSQYNLNKFSV